MCRKNQNKTNSQHFSATVNISSAFHLNENYEPKTKSRKIHFVRRPPLRRLWRRFAPLRGTQRRPSGGLEKNARLSLTVLSRQIPSGTNTCNTCACACVVMTTSTCNTCACACACACSHVHVVFTCICATCTCTCQHVTCAHAHAHVHGHVTCTCTCACMCNM